MGIVPGRSYSARQLLDGMLLASGNDAATTMADLLGGYDTAVAKMNATAAALGATHTHAATLGLDGPGGSGATTPRDLAVLFRAALANPVFAGIVASPTASFPGENGPITLVNTNELLGRYPGRSAARPDSPTPPRKPTSAPPPAMGAGWSSR